MTPFDLKGFEWNALSRDLFKKWRYPMFCLGAFLLIFLVLYYGILFPRKMKYQTLKARYSVLVRQQSEYQKGLYLFEQKKDLSDERTEKLAQFREFAKDPSSYINRYFILDPGFQELTFSNIRLRHGLPLSPDERKLTGQGYDLSKATPFQKTEFELVAKGKYDHLGLFWEKISMLPILFTIHTVTISKNYEGKEPLKMTLKLHFYYIRP